MQTIVVDNENTAQSNDILDFLVAKYPKQLLIIKNQQNLGIATALNQGIQEAIEQGYQWAATFDQDSTVTDDFFEKMIFTYNQCDFKEQVALISPVYKDKNTELKTQLGKPNSQPFAEIKATLTSGNLVKTDLLKKIVFFEDKLFIYHVDTDICLKLRKFGFKIIESSVATLLHQEGDAKLVQFLFKK